MASMPPTSGLQTRRDVVGTPAFPSAEQLALATARGGLGGLSAKAGFAIPRLPSRSAVVHEAGASPPAPAPTPIPLLQDEAHAFQVPVRRILSPQDMGEWEASHAYHIYLLFLQSLNAAVQDRTLQDPCPMSEVVECFSSMRACVRSMHYPPPSIACRSDSPWSATQRLRARAPSRGTTETQMVERLLGLIDTLDAWIGEIPPQDSPQRFGNRAFRTWLDAVEARA